MHTLGDERALSIRITEAGLMDLKSMAVEVDQINETLSRVLDADQGAMLIDLLRESAREVEAGYRAVTGQDV